MLAGAKAIALANGRVEEMSWAGIFAFAAYGPIAAMISTEGIRATFLACPSVERVLAPLPVPLVLHPLAGASVSIETVTGETALHAEPFIWSGCAAAFVLLPQPIATSEVRPVTSAAERTSLLRPATSVTSEVRRRPRRRAGQELA